MKVIYLVTHVSTAKVMVDKERPLMGWGFIHKMEPWWGGAGEMDQGRLAEFLEQQVGIVVVGWGGLPTLIER